MNWDFVAPVALLCISNVFMTFAWYGQLKFPHTSLLVLIPVCWGLAFFEYCLVVPATHFGARVYSPVQLKVIQEVVTLIIFALFSIFYLGDSLKWNHFVAFGLLVTASFFAFKKF
jgi:uncharacterized protein (DUF486 family)